MYFTLATPYFRINSKVKNICVVQNNTFKAKLEKNDWSIEDVKFWQENTLFIFTFDVSGSDRPKQFVILKNFSPKRNFFLFALNTLKAYLLNRSISEKKDVSSVVFTTNLFDFIGCYLSFSLSKTAIKVFMFEECITPFNSQNTKKAPFFEDFVYRFLFGLQARYPVFGGRRYVEFIVPDQIEVRNKRYKIADKEHSLKLQTKKPGQNVRLLFLVSEISPVNAVERQRFNEIFLDLNDKFAVTVKSHPLDNNWMNVGVEHDHVSGDTLVEHMSLEQYDFIIGLESAALLFASSQKPTISLLKIVYSEKPKIRDDLMTFLFLNNGEKILFPKNIRELSRILN